MNEVSLLQQVIPFKGRDALLTAFEKFCHNSEVTLLIEAGSRFREAVTDFESLFTCIQAAGGIVKNPEGDILFIKRFGKWDFPKGKLEENESPEQGALREVNEETGLEGLVIAGKLPSTIHIYQGLNQGMILKQTHWYSMNIQTGQIPFPQAEEGITEARWIPQAEAGNLLSGSYASLIDLFQEMQK